LRRCLRESGLRGLLVEGGPKTTEHLVRLGLWDEAYRLMSPKHVPAGGPTAPKLYAPWHDVAQWGLDELQRCERVTFKS